MAKTYRILSIDGGGMRGYYSALYLNALCTRYAKKHAVEKLDLGLAVHMITGTSTGAILGCAIAKGVNLKRVAELYKSNGPLIFSRKVPSEKGFELLRQLFTRHSINRAGAIALEDALKKELGDTTISHIWNDRGIALAIPAVEMSKHRAWVFKTPHVPSSHDRDGGYSLVDVCLATTAAPVFRSLAAVDNPDDDGYLVFADGGLWANNPVLVGLTDALAVTEPGDTIEIFCLGTCPRPEGTPISKNAVHLGITDWKFGASVLTVANSAQEYAYDNMARMIGKHVGRTVKVLRFPRGSISKNLMPYLDLDETLDAGLGALSQQAQTDASQAMSELGDADNPDGQIFARLFNDAGEAAQQKEKTS